ncbi:LptA/OstA family protein [Jiella marina]|uniref:LptA/OstA family protein n=1 Tax=Jiella sp. LLJ827 TaxID=2917712 RepID=UPI0021019EF0|nr:LptA/OstA family protein [Jiella sp. LLJ827]MCQ0989513.1 OstA family protein [Jiella sp. LLJ827]
MSLLNFRLPAICLGALLATTVFAAAQNQAEGRNFGALQIRGDQPIAIESDQLDVDDRKTVATFTGNVSVRQGETALRSGKLIVYYKRDGAREASAEPSAGALPSGSSQIEKLEATGNVYVKSADQVATADRASFDMSSEVVLMTGNVVLTQGENVAEGCRLQIEMDTGVARLESRDCGGAAGGGRVRLMLTPGQDGN